MILKPSGKEFGGGRILTASLVRARLWDRDGKRLAVLEGHTGVVDSAVFAPDGGRILTASWDKTARLWDAFPQRRRWSIASRLRCCAASPLRNGNHLYLAPTPPSRLTNVLCRAISGSRALGQRLSGCMMEEDAAVFAQLLQKGNKAHRRYELKTIDGRLMLVRNELDRMFDSALSDVLGCEIEPDDKDGMFLD